LKGILSCCATSRDGGVIGRASAAAPVRENNSSAAAQRLLRAQLRRAARSDGQAHFMADRAGLLEFVPSRQASRSPPRCIRCYGDAVHPTRKADLKQRGFSQEELDSLCITKDSISDSSGGSSSSSSTVMMQSANLPFAWSFDAPGERASDADLSSQQVVSRTTKLSLRRQNDFYDN